MANPREQRNKALVERRDSDPERWSFSALGRFYGISAATAFEIYHREKAKSGAPVPAFVKTKYKGLAKAKTK